MGFAELRQSSKFSIAGVLLLACIGPIFIIKIAPFFSPLDFYGTTVLQADYDITRPHLGERKRGMVLRHADASTSRATHERLNIPFSFTTARGGYGKFYNAVRRMCERHSPRMFQVLNDTLGFDAGSPKRVIAVEVTYRRFHKESLPSGRSQTVLVDGWVPFRCDASDHARRS